LSAKTAQATYDLAKRLEETRGLTLLDRTPFSDTDAVAVLKSTARKEGLRALGDLKHVQNLRLGGLPEFRTRNTGLVGLRRNYGLDDVTFVPLSGISPYVALDRHQIDAAAVFSTDPPLGKGSKYTVLDDPAHQFGFQNVAPVVKESVVKRLGSDFTETLDAVSRKLTQPAIVAMNKAVIVDKKSPAAVARQFLQANDLV
jgi:osmoprotectant transport system substrate-binding protein